MTRNLTHNVIRPSGIAVSQAVMPVCALFRHYMAKRAWRGQWVSGEALAK